MGFRQQSRMLMACLILGATCLSGIASGADEAAPQTSKRDNKIDAAHDTKPTQPCITDTSGEEPCVEGNKQPQFVKDSPFDTPANPATPKRERGLWADSWLWAKSPEFVVEKWIGDKPDLKGKYVLIEFWATWCGPCRRSITLLNSLHQKYGDELIVIGICEEDEKALAKMPEEFPSVPNIEFYSAVDTKKRMKDKLGVWGIPHAILLEPDGYVIWEGFPLQPGYELTEKIIERVLAIGRSLK